LELTSLGPQNNSRVSGFVTLRGSFIANPNPAPTDPVKIFVDGNNLSGVVAANGIWNVGWDTTGV